MAKQLVLSDREQPVFDRVFSAVLIHWRSDRMGSGENSDDRCMHQGCDCPVQGEADYCSEDCRRESKAEEHPEECHCGHGSCEPE